MATARRYPTATSTSRTSRRRLLTAGAGLGLAAPIAARAPHASAGDATPVAPDSAGTPRPGATPAGGATPVPTQPLPPEASVAAATRFIAEMMDLWETGDTPRLARSYIGGQLEADGFDPAFTYDNALAIIALLDEGGEESVRRARALGDGILFTQETDPAGDGRIRDAYTPVPFVTDEGVANIAFGFGQGGTAVGNMAWAAIALCQLARRTEDDGASSGYLDGAVRMAEWVEEVARSDTGPGGYTFGLVADGSSPTYKSIEHNTDLVALFALLDELGAEVPEGGPAWAERREHALALVEAMWEPDGGFFYTGTGEDGATINPSPIPEDAQTWTYLALGNNAYRESIDWAIQNLSATDGVFVGVSFSDADTSKVWFEGTAHVVCALNARALESDAALVTQYLDTLGLAQVAAPNADGTGIVAASGDGLDTGFGFEYFASRHVGATAWYLMAALGTNPYVFGT